MQEIDLKEVRRDGVLTEQILKQIPGYPVDFLPKANGPVVVIECAQNIPCNPCETVCPKKAISVGEPITNLPTVDPEKCIGCGICVAACPGLAIFLVDMSKNDGNATVTFAYEYLPVPVKGEAVEAIDRSGNVVCKATVGKITHVKSYDMTNVITISVPLEFAGVARGIKLKREE